MKTFSASTPVSLGPLSLPYMWAYLIANCITQYPTSTAYTYTRTSNG
ncbi:hypothetical protein GBAR_LOCUS20734 [Geodia barretti]|uniref:Uncharacterized protein n=1 Tax=Geodia barretti TaxID=519541 RepID=A0AA35SX84_GEOBA|nr:hypothetical protein GBAR_LOCUS20734 [Geodia barretti]